MQSLLAKPTARMVAILSHRGLIDKPNDTIVEPVRVTRGVTTAIFPLKSSLYLSAFEVAVEFGFRQEAYGSALGS